MKIVQSRSFERKVKRLKKQEKGILDSEIRRIVSDPSIGTEKKGDLRGVYVHKFNIHSTQYLLAYRIDEETLGLIMLGPRENYYRDLKKVLNG